MLNPADLTKEVVALQTKTRELEKIVAQLQQEVSALKWRKM